MRPPEPPDESGRDASNCFTAIYEQTYRKTLAYAIRRTSSQADAFDVVAETYMIGWRRVNDLCRAKEPQAWLYAVAYRVLTNHRRGARRREGLSKRAASQEAALSAVEEDPAWLVEKNEELDRVRAAMAILSDTDQEALRLAAFEELTHGEIAVVLGIRKPLVRSVLYRARRRLKQALAADTERQENASGHNDDEKGGPPVLLEDV